MPASRPRVTRYGTHNAKPYSDWLKTIATILPGLTQPLIGNEGVSIHCHFYCTKARTSKLLRPRGDLDNYVKALLDSMTHAGTYWTDDVQVTALVASKQFSSAEFPAGIVLTVGVAP